MEGFEPETSGVGSANCATTTTLVVALEEPCLSIALKFFIELVPVVGV